MFRPETRYGAKWPGSWLDVHHGMYQCLKATREASDRRHSGLPMKVPRRRTRWPFVARALDDGQGRIPREPGIGRRALAQAERRPATGLDDAGVPARRAQARVRRRHVAE